MAEHGIEVTEERAGSAWLAGAGDDERSAILVGLLSRFNHDLRTPLNTVVGWTHLMQQGTVDNARSKHVADVLARNTREQTVLLDDFVDDGRAVLGVLKIDPIPLPVDRLIASALERAAPMLSLHGVSANASTALADGVVQGDERRLSRLIYRLLVAVARRAREAAVIDLAVSRRAGKVQVRFVAPASAADWPEATLLDLRISSFVAAMHGAQLIIDGAPDTAAIVLQMPAST